MTAWIVWGGLIALVWSLLVAYAAASVGWASRVPLPEAGDGESAGPEAARQLHPAVVDAFLDREDAMRRIYYEVSTN